MADEHAPGSASFSVSGVDALRGQLDGSSLRVGVVVSRFNSAITGRLYDGAVAEFIAAGVSPANIVAWQVPGAVELPLAAASLAAAGDFDALVVLGCVIRGETAHFDFVCRAATDGVLRVQLDNRVPVGFGVLTCETAAQAQARAGDTTRGERNAGAEAAQAALELAALRLA
jgi:6,7-dimethyl-8-ribityllumazine synthase